MVLTPSSKSKHTFLLNHYYTAKGILHVFVNKTVWNIVLFYLTRSLYTWASHRTINNRDSTLLGMHHGVSGTAWIILWCLTVWTHGDWLCTDLFNVKWIPVIECLRLKQRLMNKQGWVAIQIETSMSTRLFSNCPEHSQTWISQDFDLNYSTPLAPFAWHWLDTSTEGKKANQDCCFSAWLHHSSLLTLCFIKSWKPNVAVVQRRKWVPLFPDGHQQRCSLRFKTQLLIGRCIHMSTFLALIYSNSSRL